MQLTVKMVDGVLIDIITDNHFYLSKIEFHFGNGKKLIYNITNQYLFNQMYLVKFCTDYNFRNRGINEMSNVFTQYIVKQIKKSLPWLELSVTKKILDENKIVTIDSCKK